MNHRMKTGLLNYYMMMNGVKMKQKYHCVTDSMLTATEFLEDNERQHICNAAPAEGNIPLSVFRDK